MIRIDGSFGEGGGQILRSALTLAAARGVGVRIENIRARRPKPGLRAQHLAAVRAAARICNADVTGDRIGSRELTFEPGEVAAGEYRFEIGTAGSAALVLQTVFLPLAMAGGASLVTVCGGTHNPWAPCFEYLQRCWLAALEPMGVRAELHLDRAGFYPAGGGRIEARIPPAPPPAEWRPIRLERRGELRALTGFSAVANLPTRIGQRQQRRAVERLESLGLAGRIERVQLEADSPGTVLFLHLQFEQGSAAFFGLGARGKPAERVADEAVDALAEYWRTEAPVDPHLADQLLLPAALCAGESCFATSRLTDHLRTNAHVIERLLARRITIDGAAGAAGTVTVG
jgi:RNA 3'-terminal phosphate cyclase (ATP)